jgi:hypothetical protein
VSDRLKKAISIWLLVVLPALGIMVASHNHINDPFAAAGRFLPAGGHAGNRGEHLADGICLICFFAAHSQGLMAGEIGSQLHFHVQNRPLPARDIVPGSSSVAAISPRAPPRTRG